MESESKVEKLHMQEHRTETESTHADRTEALPDRKKDTEDEEVMTPVADSEMEVIEEHKVVDTEAEKEERSAVDKRISMLHDSMVTVRLSEPSPPRPPSPMVNTSTGQSVVTKVEPPDILVAEEVPEPEVEESPRITMLDEEGNEVFDSPAGSESANGESRRGSDSSEESVEEVNWEGLQQTEEKEPRDESSDDSTALLLARLEQENNLLVSNPKSGIAKVQPIVDIRQRASRPPSIQHLKRLVNGPTPAALRYSMIPAPPMTDLEFYAALVQDYTRTAQCLPTLLSKKIRSGIPPPLRGVVWQSMSGARDSLLEDQFDRLCGESSPYEGIIGKDLGRSFPGVEMFRDSEGDGQRMLGRVLKCFSLYDNKIGYCQGLGFLVGPLLMHMGDKQAFCVLVRLMEHYDLRACFLPDLSGLHVRIYQFRQLLKQHIPNLAAHLDNLQIKPGYVSQWFLSFFAVTCPLPMLFRIYDVIFAEGASETIMRVALSLMRKNEEKIMACTEFEDVMQLLLSRGLWDVYHYNADEFVNDFVGLTGVVTHESLQALEMSYKEAQVADAVTPLENVGTAATRFLGRLWAGSNASTKSMTLSPGLTAPARPVSFLRRSPSKQSIASTLNSIEGGGSDSMLSSSTDATSRDSSNTDGSSIRTHSANFNNAAVVPTKSNKDKNLHGQIEDLLTALSELQRDHATLATQLQREREEREEDKSAVRALLDGLRKKTGTEPTDGSSSEHSVENIKTVSPEARTEIENEAGDDTITPDPESKPAESEPEATNSISPTEHNLCSLLDLVESRFSAPNRRSSMLTTKSQLRNELVRAKEQLIIEISKTQEFSRRLDDQKQEIKNLTEEVKEGHGHIRSAHTDKQRLERQIYELRMSGRKGSASGTSGMKTPEEKESEWPTMSMRTSSGSSSGGLRELKLGRANSNKSVKQPFSKRTSSLNAASLLNKEIEPIVPMPVLEQGQERGKEQADIDALVLELVQAKTAKAVAEQEAEEARGKLEALKKMLSGSGANPEYVSHSMGGKMGHRASPSTVSVSTGGLGGYFAGVGGYGHGAGAGKTEGLPGTTPPAVTGAGSGFWGGWGKRVASSGSGGS